MPQNRNVVALLAYNATGGTPPDVDDFRKVMVGDRYSLQRYWKDNAGGVVDLTRFDLFGPYRVQLPQISKDAQGNLVRPDRATVVELVRAEAEKAQVDLGPYDATVVVLHGATSTGPDGVEYDYDVGASGTVCLLPNTQTTSYFDHEMGHVLGFEHSNGIMNSGGDFSNDGVTQVYPFYGSPYDLMSAQSFGGTHPQMAIAGTPTTSYPASAVGGPMLARAALHFSQPDLMDAAGTVLRRTEGGTTSVVVFPAGTGAADRPDLLVYRTAGGGEVFVEYRVPGPERDSNWWDTGLTDAAQRPAGAGGDNDVAGGLVVHHRAPNLPPGGDCLWYSGRIAFPGPDRDTTFTTPDGTFTVSVSDSQHPVGDRVAFSIARGAPTPSLMVFEDSHDEVRVLSSELRRHPRYPDEGPFTWQVTEVTRQVTYTPRSLGIGGGWPLTPTEHSTVVVQWSVDGGAPLSNGTSGTVGSLRYALALDTGVLVVTNDPAAGTLSIPIRAGAMDTTRSAAGELAATADVLYAVHGHSEGWGPDFLRFLTRGLKDLLNRKFGLETGPVLPDTEPDPVLFDSDRIRELHELITQLRPDVGRTFDTRIAAREVRVESRLHDVGEVGAIPLSRRIGRQVPAHLGASERVVR